MATYAVGDVQGCYSQLRRLLDRCRFDPARDKLWLVGDLVNRGPHSLAVLRFVKGMGERAVTVLGNHDLHLLVLAAGHTHKHTGDTLDAILRAPDRDELLDWVRHRPLMHVGGGYAMVHAGLLPQWSIAKALKLAHEVEAVLRGPRCDEFLRQMYGNKPARWRDDLTGVARWRIITNALTRLRICTPDGGMEFSHKGTLLHLPKGYMPWYTAPRRRSRTTPIICGHWASLGLYTGSNVVSLDTGCVWNGSLTAFRLNDGAFYSYVRPGTRLPPEQ